MKYYWLKLKKDFFKRHDIRIVEEMTNGKDYILFYLKLLCESLDHNGNLRFSERIPYSEEMLATVTNTNVDIVRNAVAIFSELGMMELMDDGTFFMTEVEKMIGSASANDGAIRQARFREKKKLEEISVTKSNATVTLPVTNNNESKSKNKNKSKNIDIGQISDLYNTICTSLPKVERLTDKRRNKIIARLKVFTEEQIEQAFHMAEESDFLSGRSGKWKASFDWLMDSDTHLQRVLEGNYADREKKSSNEFIALLESGYGQN